MVLSGQRTVEWEGFLSKDKLGKVWIVNLCHILEEFTQENSYWELRAGEAQKYETDKQHHYLRNQ